MSSEAWVPLISALLGAVIGSLSSVATVFIQTRASRKTKLAEMSVLAAIEQYKSQLELSLEVAQRSGRKINIPPLAAYMYAMEQHIRLIDRGNISPEDIMKVSKDSRERTQIFRENIDS